MLCADVFIHIRPVHSVAVACEFPIGSLRWRRVRQPRRPRQWHADDTPINQVRGDCFVVTWTQAIRDAMPTAVLTPCLDDRRFVPNAEPTDVIQLAWAEPVQRRTMPQFGHRHEESGIKFTKHTGHCNAWLGCRAARRSRRTTSSEPAAIHRVMAMRAIAEPIRIPQIAMTSALSLLRMGASQNNNAIADTTISASSSIERRAVRGNSGRWPHTLQYHRLKTPSGSNGTQNT